MSASATSYAGLTVLEMTSVIAGPFAAGVFADLGADVIKIERPVKGDDSRVMPPFADGESTLFSTMNRNKRSVVLDVKTDEGREQYLRLAARSDVVIEGFRPGVADRLSIGYSAILERNPTVVYCSISGFGETPGGVGLPGYDPLIQAMSGLMSMTGEKGQPPVRSAASVIDLTTGMWAAMGVMAALARRATTGGTQYVESTLFDSGYALLGHQVASMLATGAVPAPLGSASPIAAPYEAFETSDGWLMIATGNDVAYGRLCRALDAEQFLTDERYRTNVDRVSHRDELHAELHELFVHRTTADLLAVIQAAGVPVAPVNRLDEAVALPLVAERGIIIDSEEGIATVRSPLDDARPATARRAPRLGEHTDEVLSTL